MIWDFLLVMFCLLCFLGGTAFVAVAIFGTEVGVKGFRGRGGMEESCICKGTRSYTWHYQNNVPQCPHSRAERAAYRAGTRHGKWTPGTDIEIPEYDPL